MNLMLKSHGHNKYLSGEQYIINTTPCCLISFDNFEIELSFEELIIKTLEKIRAVQRFWYQGCPVTTSLVYVTDGLFSVSPVTRLSRNFELDPDRQ